MTPDLVSRGLVAAAILVVTLASPGNITAAANASAGQTTTTPVPPPKEKRSQEDIMFGNQQNKPAGGMVDDLFQGPEPQRPNNTNTHQGNTLDDESREAEKSSHRQEQQQQQQELPDRLDYYDYIQPETSESAQPQTTATAEEDDDEEEEVDRTSGYGQQDRLAFGSQRLLPASPSQLQGDSDLGEYPSSEDELESSSLYRRRKRGVLRRLRSPLDDLLSPAGGPFRRRRGASAGSPLRLKRDAASNELLNWLVHMSGPAVVAGARRKNHGDDDVDVQELNFPGPEPEALEVASMPAYLFDQVRDDDQLDEEEEESGLPASLLESLALQEEGEEWEPPVRGPARRRSAFYPLDYRYVLLPGARKRAGNGFMGMPNGHFGAVHQTNRWPGEPQSGHWGHIPLRPMQQQQQQFLRGAVQFQQPQPPIGVMRRRAPMQESDTNRLYALASLLASQEGQLGAEDKRRRRRSPRPPSPLKG